MASLGGSYWCHQCNRTVRPANTDELICPTCGGSFLEEIEGPGASDFPGVGAHDGFEFGGGDRFNSSGGVPAGFRRYQPEGRGLRGFPVRSGGHPAVLQVLEAMSAVLNQNQPPGGHESGEVDTSRDGPRDRSGGVSEGPSASNFPGAGAHDGFGFGGGDRFDASGGMPAGSRPVQPEGRGMRGFPDRSGGHPAVLQVLEAMSAVLNQNQPPPGGHESGEVDTSGDGPRDRSGGVSGGDVAGQGFNPMLMLQGQMQNFLGGGGNVEVFFDNGTGIPRRLPGNFGDYFLGPGLDQLIQQLAENDPNRYGAPPASKSAVEAMPTIKISDEHLGTDAAQCAVCKDEFTVGMSVRQMPCKHMYHEECIMPWLAVHNSCPVCRYEMPTDDQDYDRSRSSDHAGNAASGSSATRPLRATSNSAGSNAEGGGTSGGFTFWGSPAGFGGSSAPPSVSQSSSAPAAAASAPAPSGGGFGRRFSMHLPWFRSSTPPPAPAPGPGPSGGNGGNSGSGPRGTGGDEPHPELG